MWEGRGLQGKFGCVGLLAEEQPLRCLPRAGLCRLRLVWEGCPVARGRPASSGLGRARALASWHSACRSILKCISVQSAPTFGLPPRWLWLCPVGVRLTGGTFLERQIPRPKGSCAALGARRC